MVTYEMMRTVRIVAVEVCKSFSDGMHATAETVHSASEAVQWTVWGATMTSLANMVASSPPIIGPAAKMLGLW